MTQLLQQFAEAMSSGAIRTIDLTQTLSPDTPTLVLPEESVEVARRVGADHGGGVRPAVGHLDADLLRALDDVVVGQDVAVRGDHEARPAALLQARLALGAEELLQPGRNPALGGALLPLRPDKECRSCRRPSGT